MVPVPSLTHFVCIVVWRRPSYQLGISFHESTDFELRFNLTASTWKEVESLTVLNECFANEVLGNQNIILDD